MQAPAQQVKAKLFAFLSLAAIPAPGPSKDVNDSGAQVIQQYQAPFRLTSEAGGRLLSSVRCRLGADPASRRKTEPTGQKCLVPF
jgi:hypothetical protein